MTFDTLIIVTGSIAVLILLTLLYVNGDDTTLKP